MRALAYAIQVADRRCRSGASNQTRRALACAAGKTRIDGREVMARVKRTRSASSASCWKAWTRSRPATKFRAARFIDDNTLQVDEHTRIVAQRIVIATGSRPSWPAPWGELGDRLIVNDDLFNWDDLPQSVAVFGPGVIGLELGRSAAPPRRRHQGLRHRRRGRAADRQRRARLRCEGAGEEFYLDADVKVEMMQREGDKVFIRYRDLQGQPQEITVDYVLAATGRRPNVDRLGLENTGLQLDARGVPLADRLTMQTSVPHIFIAGDASNQLPLLHEASDQARIAGANAGSFQEINPGLKTRDFGGVLRSADRHGRLNLPRAERSSAPAAALKWATSRLRIRAARE